MLYIYGTASEKVSNLCFTENFKYGRVGVFQVGRQAGLGHPSRLADVFLALGDKLYRFSVEHIVPPGMFEMPDAVPYIAMVCNTDKIAKLEFVYAGLFLNFAYSSYFDILTLFAMAFR